MNILLIHQAFVSPNQAGGTRHYEIARHFTKRGHSFTVITSDRSYLSQNTSSYHKTQVETTSDGVTIRRVRTVNLGLGIIGRLIGFLSFMITAFFAALQVDVPHVVLGTSPPIFQAVTAWLVSFVCRKPFVLEIRDLWPIALIELGVLNNPILVRMANWLEKFLYTHADYIIINSPAYHKHIVDKGVLPEKITFIPNGVDTKMFDPQADGQQIRKEFDLVGKFVVVYAGSLGFANDIETILKAANHLRDEVSIQFMLFGDGANRFNLEKMAQSLDVTNVTFAGVRPKSQMPDILAAADICIATLKDIPQYRMTYPNKIFDYMAAGRPIVLGIDGVIRKVVDAAKAGIFVQPGDDAALAEAVRQLQHQPEKAKAMGISARAYVIEHFDRQQQADLFLKLLERIVNP